MKTLLLALIVAAGLQAADVVSGEGVAGASTNVVITLDCTGKNAAYVLVTFVDYLGTYTVSSTSAASGAWTANTQWGSGVFALAGHWVKGVTLSASEVFTVGVASGSPYLTAKAVCFSAGSSTPTFAGVGGLSGGGNQQFGAVTPGTGGLIFTGTCYAYNSTVTPPAGYTISGTEITSGQGVKVNMYYKIATDGSAMNPTWNWDNVAATGGNGAFSAASGGAVTTRRLMQ